ncbi:MAG: lamin tail domain-containing protein, partial [Chloroflexota bacterium]|nr:lamin tail domain-containing protein [Chloroflexota bacterium]
SKRVDGGDEWTRHYQPSPGGSNIPPPVTLTPIPTATLTPSPTPSNPTPFPTSIRLNEYLPKPGSDWNGDGQVDPDDEFIELYNSAGIDVDVSGWILDDAPGGSPVYVIPQGTMAAPHSYLVFFRSQTGVALNDTGDNVRLLWPDDTVVDQTLYSAAGPDLSFSRETDGSGSWVSSYPPSPGSSNQPAYTSDDIIRLNEILASPRDVDWDGDGTASYLDEWVELFNAGDTIVDLGGWKVADGPPPGAERVPGEQSRIYTFPSGAMLAPGDFLVLFRHESGLALNARDESVRLLHPDDTVADQFQYDRFSGYDDSWCRLPDGDGDWVLACNETPGAHNQPGPGGTGSDSGGSTHSGPPEPPYDRFNHDLVTVAQARVLPDGARRTIEGQVTVLPDVHARNQIYIQDASGGLRVYLRSAEWPPLSEGQWVRVNGRLKLYKGEQQISLTRIDDIKTMHPGAPPEPHLVASGEIGEANEGRLVQLTAPISGFWGRTTLYLDDGSGEAKITIREGTGIERPYVTVGDLWTVVGVVSQWDDQPPYDAGYRILPRRPSDLWQGGTAPDHDDRFQVDNDMTLGAWNRSPVFLPLTGEQREGVEVDGREAWRWIGMVISIALDR